MKLNSSATSLLALTGLLLSLAPIAAQAQRILPPVPEVNVTVPNRFGTAIAASSKWLLVGAPGEDTPGIANAGAAHLYELNGGGHIWRAQLIAADAGADDEFGAALAISNDVLVIGAPGDNLPAGSGAGSAYVFERNGQIWEQRAKLIAPNAATGDQFGTAVAISGQAIVVGALDDDIDGVGANVGSAHLFQKVGGSWTYTQRLLASDPTVSARFGRTVAIFGDRVLVGSTNIDDGAGAVYAFRFGNDFAGFEGRLVADDQAPSDGFGSALAMDGVTAVVGARRHNGGGGPNSGAGYVFARTGTQWSQRAKLLSPDPRADEQMGYSAALSGGMALLGAPYSTSGPCCEQGRASLFLGSAGGWQFLRHLVVPDVFAYDLTGFAVALTEAGPLAGAPESNDPVSGADATGSVIRIERGLSLFRDGFEANGN